MNKFIAITVILLFITGCTQPTIPATINGKSVLCAEPDDNVFVCEVTE